MSDGNDKTPSDISQKELSDANTSRLLYPDMFMVLKRII